MKKILLCLLSLHLITGNLYARDNTRVSAISDNKMQWWRDAKLGLFIHWGPYCLYGGVYNGFQQRRGGAEWIMNRCKIPYREYRAKASTFNPVNFNAEKIVCMAKDAGMKYVILVAKHHEGFCLWDSNYTEYDVANSGNKTNVIEEVAKACKKYDIGLGLYYSLWDRKVNADVKDKTLDAAYNEYMIKQLNELIDIVQPYTHIVEFWFDGGWEKEHERWPAREIYQTIKSREPECQIGINWTIGLPENPDAHPVLPENQKEGYPIRYFPSDFRLGDPYLPADNDPKLFSHDGKLYYMPWESTICISERWFYNTTDKKYKTVEELAGLYHQCTKNDNILILNCPPNREGKIRDADVTLLKELRKKIQM